MWEGDELQVLPTQCLLAHISSAAWEEPIEAPRTLMTRVNQPNGLISEGRRQFALCYWSPHCGPKATFQGLRSIDTGWWEDPVGTQTKNLKMLQPYTLGQNVSLIRTVSLMIKHFPSAMDLSMFQRYCTSHATLSQFERTNQRIPIYLYQWFPNWAVAPKGAAESLQKNHAAFWMYSIWL